MNMQTVPGAQPFLYRFRTLLPEATTQDEPYGYDSAKQMNCFEDGTPVIYAGGRAKKPYTNAFTAGRTIPGGYTPSGKWRPSKYRPGKTDKRSGK